MRFVSRWGRHSVQIQSLIQEAYATGAIKVLQDAVYAQFYPEGLLPHERELALIKWTWNGFYQQEDEVTVVPPDRRIGVFDSVIAQQQHRWSDEVREMVEAELIRLSQEYNDILVIPRTVVPPPWPRYDEYGGSPKGLIRKLSDEGHSLEQTLEYERAMQNRPGIVEALEQALANPDLEFEEEVVG
jgi:hypothetical protein